MHEQRKMLHVKKEVHVFLKKKEKIKKLEIANVK